MEAKDVEQDGDTTAGDETEAREEAEAGDKTEAKAEADGTTRSHAGVLARDSISKKAVLIRIPMKRTKLSQTWAVTMPAKI